VLFLLLQLGSERYALDIRQVAEVLPLVDMKPVPRAPAGVAGVFNYGGVPVPVIDLSQLILERAARRRLNTRIVVVHFVDESGKAQLLGLIAERATEAVRREPSDFRATGVTNTTAPHLGPVALDAAGPIHWIEVNRLLPASLRASLFQQPLAS
jgi:chemotaxis-related protein WspB